MKKKTVNGKCVHKIDYKDNKKETRKLVYLISYIVFLSLFGRKSDFDYSYSMYILKLFVTQRFKWHDLFINPMSG
jgi:hypothetical protein